MPVTINGTTGIAGVDGSASTPAVQGSDTNTGEFFPAADTIAWTTGGSERMRVDSSGNVGIGTNSPVQKLHVANGNVYFSTPNYVMWDTNGNYGIQSDGSSRLSFFAGSGSERMRIDATGCVLVNGTTPTSVEKFNITHNGATNEGMIIVNTNSSAGTHTSIGFRRPSGTTVGTITTTTSTTAYNTSSDYRLKNSIAPLASSLSTISALKPVSYKWNVDDSVGEGFIAHELAEHIPLAVVGEKDAVDGEGNIRPQGVDYSKIVVHLVAAIQELSAKVDAQAAEIAALKANAPAQ